MCDPTPIRNWLLAIVAAIVVAIALIIAAAVTNGSFWLAWQSPGWMAGAFAATALAALFCGFAIDALDVFCKCAGSKCSGECANMRNTLNAARVVLGIQALACLYAALQAWIPIYGLGVMIAIGAALVIQLGLIASAIFFFSALERCNNLPPPTGSGSGPLGGPSTRETSLDA